MDTPIKLLFLCTGNSCRSIIGEALANHLGQGRLLAYSAGSQPTGKVNAHALEVLARHGVTPEDPRSQSWDEFEQVPLDLVITVCASAAGETCPIWFGEAPKVHWGVEDPAHVVGDQATIDAAFEKTYQEMHQRLSAMLALPLETLDQQQLKNALVAIHQAAE
ncbi:MAG: low molecular weight phosphatase family protein [Gammaproteobacteria bacterium HGW-Gammaproteobacteria-14]|nr:MAG: low molecular weight phosphatase family protein [Gammaproteobacteria bacterium HGW-Gammaproteobacteria-14]